MPLDPKVNAENPPKPGQRFTAPSGTTGFHVPSVQPQPMIDPLSGKLITSEGPQNVNPAQQGAPQPAGQPNPAPAPAPGPGAPPPQPQK